MSTHHCCNGDYYGTISKSKLKKLYETFKIQRRTYFRINIISVYITFILYANVTVFFSRTTLNVSFIATQVIYLHLLCLTPNINLYFIIRFNMNNAKILRKTPNNNCVLNKNSTTLSQRNKTNLVAMLPSTYWALRGC